MIRRLPADVPVRKPDSDDELLRIVASAANEAVDALELPPAKVAAALNEVVVRYARTLRLTTRILHDALRDAKSGAEERRRRDVGESRRRRATSDARGRRRLRAARQPPAAAPADVAARSRAAPLSSPRRPSPARAAATG